MAGVDVGERDGVRGVCGSGRMWAAMELSEYGLFEGGRGSGRTRSELASMLKGGDIDLDDSLSFIEIVCNVGAVFGRRVEVLIAIVDEIGDEYIEGPASEV